MTSNPTPPSTSKPPRQPSFAKYFWLSAAAVAVPVLGLFNFLPLPGAALVIGLGAVLIGGGIISLLVRRAGKPVWSSLLWAALSGWALSAPIVWLFDLLLAAAGGTANAASFTPAMYLWSLPLPLAWLIAALPARAKEHGTS